MFRGSMTQIIKDKWENLCKSAYMLGMNQKEIEQIFYRKSAEKEQVYLTIGGPMYRGAGYYGTISIKDF